MSTAETLRTEADTSADLRNDEVVEWLCGVLTHELPWPPPKPFRVCRHCMWKFAYVTSKLMYRRISARVFIWPYIARDSESTRRGCATSVMGSLAEIREEIRLFRAKMRQTSCDCAAEWEYPRYFNFRMAPEDAVEEYLPYHKRKVEDMKSFGICLPNQDKS